jgi:hypothetical protein
MFTSIIVVCLSGLTFIRLFALAIHFSCCPIGCRWILILHRPPQLNRININIHKTIYIAFLGPTFHLDSDVLQSVFRRSVHFPPHCFEQ